MQLVAEHVPSWRFSSAALKKVIRPVLWPKVICTCALAEPEPITTTNTISARHAKLLNMFPSPVFVNWSGAPPLRISRAPCPSYPLFQGATRARTMPTVVATDAS